MNYGPPYPRPPGYNGCAAGAAIDQKIKEAQAERTPTPQNKTHPDLADIDRVIMQATETIRQVRARITAVTAVLVGETIQSTEQPPSNLPPTPCGGQIGALINSMQYALLALQDVQVEVNRLENAVGV